MEYPILQKSDHRCTIKAQKGTNKFPHKGGHICFSKDGKELYHFTVDTNIDVVKVEDLLEIIE